MKASYGRGDGWPHSHDRLGILCLLLLDSPLSAVWVFTVKYWSDDTVDRYKARLIAKDFTQTYGVNYLEMFSVARLNSISILFSLVVNQ